MHGITLVRPLLGTPKAELLTYLTDNAQPYVNDPSNENTAFDRVKMRKLLPLFAEVGITAERLARTAANMTRARIHLEEETARFIKHACSVSAFGFAKLELRNISEEIVLRALSALIMLISGNDVKMRLSELERLYTALKNPGFKGATLGGCVFTLHKGSILIYRELQGVGGSIIVVKNKPLIWDNRFEIRLVASPVRLKVEMLTQAGWLILAKTHRLKNPCPDKHILYSLPALCDVRGRIMAVPHLKFAAEGVRCEALFKAAPVIMSI